jgi:murein DD-endopeptidase MepM/ murein hydrolase activator NlpD
MSRSAAPVRGRTAWLSLAALLVAGQGAHPRAAAAPLEGTEVEQGGQPRLSGPSVMHVVREGETLWDIARAYGVTVEAIQDASGLDDVAVRKLSKGAALRIPGASRTVDVQAAKANEHKLREPKPPPDGALHRLERGETLWDVARAYDVSIDTLLRRNGLSEDAMGELQIGQAIVVPGIKQSQVRQSAPGKKPRGLTHELAPGETVWDLARRYGVSVSELMAANRLTAEEVENIRDGKRIFVPGVEDDGKGRARRPFTPRQRKALNHAKRLGLGSVRAAGALLHGRVDRRWTIAAENAGRFPGTLKWPVAKGWFVRGYGSGHGGYHKAMDIMGRTGWNVRASAPGIVGYSGDEVPGFGNMVMVVHSGGFVTLYAHNSVNFVVAGELVQRGAILAEVGSTGRSMGPHVHFELIQGGQNCDSGPLLRPGVRHRSGKVARLDYTKWRNPLQRPSAIRCAKRQKHPIAVMQENPVLDATPESEQGPLMDAPADDEGDDAEP